MKGVILAAGMGTRLRPLLDGIPKCLISLKGKPLIEYSLDNLVKTGIKETIIVLGYNGFMIKEKFGNSYNGMNLCYVENKDFDKTGSMYSLSKIKSLVNEDIILLESDLLYSVDAILNLLNSSYNDVILTSKISGSNDEVFICVDEDCNITNLGKQIETKHEAIGELVGITKLSKDYLSQLFNFAEQEFQKGILNDHYEECIFKLSKHLPIKSLLVNNLNWIEIDKKEDYYRALEEIYPKINDCIKENNNVIIKENKPIEFSIIKPVVQNKCAKVLLIYANSFMDNLIPLGISVLSACLKKAGHEVKLFDTTFYRTREETGDDSRVKTLQVRPTNLSDFGIHEKETDLISDFTKLVEEYKPDLIGGYCVEITYGILLDLLNNVKHLKIPNVVGGIFTTSCPDEVISKDCIDIICVGEGEKAIVELVEAIISNKDYSRIKNLWVKKDGVIIKNPIRPLINLNEVPDQDWSIYEKERFFKPMGGKVWIAGPIELSRGCPYNCTFCCNKKLQEVYQEHGRFYRERSVELFFNELREKKEKYGLQYLYLVAENFLMMDDEKFNEFIDGYPEFGLPFWIETRPETVNEDRLRKLKEIGCEGISIGLEHGNERFRSKMLNRHMKNELIVKAFTTAKKAGVRVCANNIIGFPTETRELLFDTIRLNKELQPNTIIVSIYSPYRGTVLRDVCVKEGYLSENSFAGDYRSDCVLDMPQLSAEAIKGLQRTFPLYVKLSEEIWPLIEKCEKFDEFGNKTFKILSEIYKNNYM